jgi:hypothetical protein
MVKKLMCEVDFSHPSSAKIKSVWSFMISANIFMVLRHGDKFTFAVILLTLCMFIVLLALASLTGGDRLIGIVCLRTKNHGVFFLYSSVDKTINMHLKALVMYAF